MIGGQFEDFECSARSAFDECAGGSFADSRHEYVASLGHHWPSGDQVFFDLGEGALCRRVMPIFLVGEREPKARIHQDHRCFRERSSMPSALKEIDDNAGAESVGEEIVDAILKREHS